VDMTITKIIVLVLFLSKFKLKYLMPISVFVFVKLVADYFKKNQF
jgi:hypothetical protein